MTHIEEVSVHICVFEGSSGWNNYLSDKSTIFSLICCILFFTFVLSYCTFSPTTPVDDPFKILGAGTDLRAGSSIDISQWIVCYLLPLKILTSDFYFFNVILLLISVTYPVFLNLI